MKHICSILLTLVTVIGLTSCSESYTADTAGMEKMNTDLQKKFGPDAWYTIVSYSVSPDNESKYVVSVDETATPDSRVQDRWVKQGADWDRLATVNIDIKNGQPKDYMFQLGKNNISLSKLGGLITHSQELLRNEKNIKDTKLKIAVIATNNVVLNNNDRFTYTVMLEDKAGKETYSFTYDLNGELKNRNP